MKSNKLIVLDLDATLISAQNLERYDREKEFSKAQKFEDQFTMDGYYHIFARPHLQTFLDFLFENFKVAVWTAASQLYALNVIENFILPKNKPGRGLEFILFDYHNEHSIKNGKGTKDLSLFSSFYKMPGYDDMVILDDFDDVIKVNKSNAIKVPFFEYKDKRSYEDTFLIRIIPRLKKFKKKKHVVGQSQKKFNGKIPFTESVKTN
jgi:TFIIF-interacting CTD phosphatase-like protein